MNIETNRLLLVPVCKEHVGDVYENFNEQIITYMAPSVPEDINETSSVVAQFIQQRENHTDYIYAITLKSNGDFIGLAGLHNLKSEVPVLGIWIKFDSHGNHFGREAIGGLINHAKILGIKKLCYPVDRRNIASKKIPLFYGGELVTNYKQVETEDGRMLEEEVYEIEICHL